jgi:MFS-type transporter involved in bile tolerance (Atg22 family)
MQVAALLIILERVGKAIRNPPRDVMLSHAAKEMGGFGWAFGVHEALDQFGALFGPLAVAAVLTWQGEYRIAFAALLVPAVLMLSILIVARVLYPRPEDMETNPPDVRTTGLPRVFWWYLAAAAHMVPVQRRASAYGLFTAGYGVCWFLGSAVIGILYDISLPAVIAFSLVAELAAIPLFILVGRQSHLVQ